MPESARHRMTGALRLCAPALLGWHALCVLGAGQGHAVRPARAHCCGRPSTIWKVGPHLPRAGALSCRSHDPRRSVRGLTVYPDIPRNPVRERHRSPRDLQRARATASLRKRRKSPQAKGKVQLRVEPEAGSGARSVSYRPDSRRRREPLRVSAACSRAGGI